ncbi:NAD(P)/FAD-dependent oxidoreductase [Colwellia asteriadis]|uniref:NAD(P)/FAD-dependent oxidoreductase n=1 Tax=Colwellia asteriadis TaxID=517723 RepID=A0ABN1L7B0_9GAMM
MNKEFFDVVVIGAGPSGAVASTLLAKRGYKVLVIEKQYFPRFSIGESLLPQCMTFLAQAGLVDSLHQHADSLAFQYKDGAAFHKNGQDTFFDFTEKFSDGPGTTYQVKRAAFDELLADGASKAGVEVRFGHQVVEVNVEPEQPELTITDEAGNNYHVKAKFLLDASGFARVLPKFLSLEKPSVFPVRHSYFTHVEDKISAADFDRNKILITVHPKHADIWYWLIPFSDGTASIGVVGRPEQFDAQATPEVILKDFIYQAPNLARLLGEANWANPVNTLQGYSADVTGLTGKNYALLGNAGEFLDPVFSSGITIALCSSALIAPQVDKYLQGEHVDFFEHFEKPLRAGVDCFKTFVSAWYEGGFQDVIFYQKQEKNVKSMISSILAGYAWDTANPYVAQSERRFKVLVDLCQ